MSTGNNNLSKIQSLIKEKNVVPEFWTGKFTQYLDLVKKNTLIIQSSWQRMYNMIMHYGKTESKENGETVIHYNFFDDSFNNGEDAVYGLSKPLMKLVQILKSAAMRYGQEKRVLLLHGPVGSAKSTIVRLFKKGLELYSRTDEGALYTFIWKDIPKNFLDDEKGETENIACPMHEEPLRLIPEEIRHNFLHSLIGKEAKQYSIEGDLCPSCRQTFNFLMEKYENDWEKMIDQHIMVKRIFLSEKDRIGIGTFQPKDEKNQDSTELTGDINYRKIAEYGSDSDPRAFNFDGEFNIANRGIIEFIEVLKLDVAFLYDLLGASQEHKIKPKKFPQTDIDEVIIGHTNEAEFKKLQNNEFMEALRDRTIKIDIPYIVTLEQEKRIYKKRFAENKMEIHVAPHTIHIASIWAVLTRLVMPTNHDLTLLQKLKLYNGKHIQGFTDDNVKDLKKEAGPEKEGFSGISPRFIQDKLSNACVSDQSYVNPFMVLTELELGIKNHSSIVDKDEQERLLELLTTAKGEYEEIVKAEIQRAISADEKQIAILCSNYIDNLKAFTCEEKVKNKYTGEYEEPDERLMRSIEEKIDISESRKDNFRSEIMKYIGGLALDNKQFNWKSNDRLREALEKKLFEDQKDTIKLSSLVTNVIDKETQAKIDVVKERLIENYGYNEESATDVLNYVSSIFARGDLTKEN